MTIINNSCDGLRLLFFIDLSNDLDAAKFFKAKQNNLGEII